MIDSRVALTRGIVDAIGRSARPPRTMVSASAVGYYQDAGSERLYEDSPRGRAKDRMRLSPEAHRFGDVHVRP